MYTILVQSLLVLSLVSCGISKEPANLQTSENPSNSQDNPYRNKFSSLKTPSMIVVSAANGIQTIRTTSLGINFLPRSDREARLAARDLGVRYVDLKDNWLSEPRPSGSTGGLNISEVVQRLDYVERLISEESVLVRAKNVVAVRFGSAVSGRHYFYNWEALVILSAFDFAGNRIYDIGNLELSIPTPNGMSEGLAFDDIVGT